MAFWSKAWTALCASLFNASGIFNLGLNGHIALSHYFCYYWRDVDRSIGFKGTSAPIYASRASPNIGVAISAIDLNGVGWDDN
jgi:ABC-type uncharacterized transport system permease subunit